MRDAALEIARQGDDFALSAAERLSADLRLIARLLRRVVRRLPGLLWPRRARRDAPLDETDPRALADLGLARGGRPDPTDPYVSVLLANARGRRDEERWRFD